MTADNSPTPIRLDGPGPFETPVVEGRPGLSFAPGELQPRVSLFFPGGKELQVPMERDAVEGLFDTHRTILDRHGKFEAAPLLGARLFQNPDNLANAILVFRTATAEAGYLVRRDVLLGLAAEFQRVAALLPPQH